MHSLKGMLALNRAKFTNLRDEAKKFKLNHRKIIPWENHRKIILKPRSGAGVGVGMLRGVLVPWFYGSMGLWFYGVCFCCGFMVLWLYGCIVLWFYDFLVSKNTK